jgi:hypothetical protein
VDCVRVKYHYKIVPSVRLWWLTLVILVTWEGGCNSEDWSSRPAQSNSSQDSNSKMTRAKWTGAMTEVVECLLCMCKALSSNLSPTKTNKKPHQILHPALPFCNSTVMQDQFYPLCFLSSQRWDPRGHNSHLLHYFESLSPSTSLAFSRQVLRVELIHPLILKVQDVGHASAASGFLCHSVD